MANFSPGVMLNGKICRKAFYIQNASGVARTFKTQVVRIFQPELKFECDYMKFPSRFVKPGWKFQPGLKLSSCNRTLLFKSFVQEAELKSQPG